MTINSFIQAGKWMCFAVAVLLTAACEKHQDTIDYSLRVGNIYCADGRVIPPEVYDKTNDCAIAVIVKLGDTQCGYKALAVGLKEWKAAASNKLTAFNGVGESRDDMNGKANTAAMLDAMFTEKPSGPDTGQQEVPLHCEAAISVEQYYEGDGSWHLPACGELLELAQNRTVVSSSLQIVGGAPLSASWYLSSTQDGTNESTRKLYMLNVSLTEGRIMSSEKTSVKTVRPFIMIQ